MSRPESSSDFLILPLADLLMRKLAHMREKGEVPVIGQDITFMAFALAHLDESKAQMAQDLWVLYELNNKRSGWFVELGAGDGELISNTWLLETVYGWRGVLAEPNVVFHKTLRRRKAFLCKDCVSSASRQTVCFNHTPDPHFSTIDTYSEADLHAELRRPGIRGEVRTISLMDLLAISRSPPLIDFLSLDTEGSELEILESLDFSCYKFGAITVEHNYGANRERIHGLLTRHGYRRKFAHLTHFDDWYVNDEALAMLRHVEPHSSGPHSEWIWERSLAGLKNIFRIRRHLNP